MIHALLALAALVAPHLPAQKKILMIDSYHQGYGWSDGIVAGVQEAIGDKASVRVHRMDTKRNTSEEFLQQAAQLVQREVESWQPDLIIAADDNASKWVIVPSYKDTALPVVFCGVNWDATPYGFPCANVTGMVEVALVDRVLGELRPYCKKPEGTRVGYLDADNITARKEAKHYELQAKVDFKSRFVEDYEGWKQAFLELQDQVDILILNNNAGIADWDDVDARKWTLANTRIPTGTVYEWMTPLSVLGFTKLPEEQGEWAATTALEILNGKSPSAIPVTKNKRGQLFLNIEVAKKLGIRFPIKKVKLAQVVKPMGVQR